MPGADEVFRLAADLSAASKEMLPKIRDVYDEIGQRFEDDWRAAAEARYDKYGRFYPKTIDHNTRFTLTGNIEVEVGPDRNKKQGRMSFERGSRNQPPHMDGLRAMQKNERLALVAVEQQIKALLP